MYFKTKSVTIKSAQIVFTLHNTNMQTFYDLLVFKVYFNCCKVEGHHLPPQMKNDPNIVFHIAPHRNKQVWII